MTATAPRTLPFNGLVRATAGRDGAPGRDPSFAQIRWDPAPAGAAPSAWAVLSPTAGPSAAAEEVRAAHPDVPLLTPGPRAGLPTGVLVVPAAGAADRTLALVEAALALPQERAPRLVVLTRGAVLARDTDRVTDPRQGVLRERVLASAGARPGRFALVDLDGHPASLRALTAALGCPRSQLAIRAGEVLAPESVPAALLPLPPGHVRLALPGPPPWRLSLIGKGTLDCLALDSCEEVGAPLVGSQVRVAVQAAGINFRDVLDALGLYPGDPGPLGAEGAGTVLDTGPDVTRLKPGDRVMGLLTGAFGPVAVTDEPLLVTVPPGWPAARAAAVPVAFATASYGLFDLGRLTAGERVLVHCASGGVGSAAVRLARHAGAEVFGTASPPKHPALRWLGLDDDHIASSRDTGFEREFLDATSGRGVDVVLNALAREATDASLRLLRPGGRFVEMGKTDPRDPDDIARDHPGVSYLPFDLREAAGPPQLAGILHDLRELFATGVLHPPTVHVFDVQDAIAAFHHMSRARHTGKLVLRIPPPEDARDGVLLVGPLADTVPLADHLATGRGSRHIWLLAPHDEDDEGLARLRSRLAGRPAELHPVNADPTDPDAVRQVLADASAVAPLTAVVHTAADDRTAPDGGGPDGDERASGEPAAGEPAGAAAILHRSTLELPLETFLLIATSGPNGPARVPDDPVRGLAALESLVDHRHSLGLAATLVVLPSAPEPHRAALLARLYETSRHTDAPVLTAAEAAPDTGPAEAAPDTGPAEGG
ncbi:zinc-binding dehydrogenase [Kitasatospora sp. NPDC057738]|uniref:zinc-binding dehydrogenase n=1 Tax=Kitasatospora sp. NPDC057738 TaxID=3346233 RepID=UPI0036860B5A